MKNDHTVSIGKLVATFGLKGELILLHQLGGKTQLKDVKALFLEMQRGNPIPYYLENAKPKSTREICIKLEGVDSKEEASKLLQKQVWLLESDFSRLVQPNAVIALLGYVVVEHGKVIGTVAEIIEQPHQVLCSVMIGGKEALIPLNEQSLLSIDRKKKEINVNLPEGLLDIYLT